MQRVVLACVATSVGLFCLYQVAVYLLSAQQQPRGDNDHQRQNASAAAGSTGGRTTGLENGVHEDTPSADVKAGMLLPNLTASDSSTFQHSRRHDFILCGNIVDKLGSAIQGLKAFLILAYELQQRGWRVRVNVPALGTAEFDHKPLWAREGTPIGSLLDVTALQTLLDTDASIDANFSRRQLSCWQGGRDVFIHQSVFIESAQLQKTRVPHRWPDLGLNKTWFDRLFDNLGALASSSYDQPIRVYWDMQNLSPAQCATFVFNSTARKVTGHMLLRPSGTEDDCAFVFVRQIVRQNKVMYLHTFPQTPTAKQRQEHQQALQCVDCFDVPVPLAAVGPALGKLLKSLNIKCAAFYVKTLGLDEQDFLQSIMQAARSAGVPFNATRIHKIPCKFCMAANTQIMQRAARAPLLISEFGTSWSDLPASNLLASGESVAYLYSGARKKPTRVQGHQKVDVRVHLADCKDGMLFRGQCIRAHDPVEGLLASC
eukprot:TRINITY_DN90065_c0_g1_i1.p1 TRINITY_DN90065_c0_g1~~TRINITY_DN90065_c0_g1_i1.p1  ORF type:complete len:486 (+),score=85.42 TRINITY_DN90065_c0_g1_i1:220-1677(+)